jgi:ankyrin repeat protein/predicted nicotinamide N-methyase
MPQENRDSLRKAFAIALHWACRRGEEAFVLGLLTDGIFGVNIEQIDRYGATPLLVACKYGHPHCVLALLRHKADVYRCDTNNASALYLLLQSRSAITSTVGEIIRRGASIGVQNSVDGMNSLHFACQNGMLETAQALIRKSREWRIPYDADLQCCKGNTALHYSVCHMVPLARVLIHEAGARTDILNNAGLTAFHVACRNGLCQMAQALAAGGSDVNAREDLESTALMIAAERGDLQLVSVLLKLKPQVDLVDVHGRSALYRACEGRHIDTVRALLAAGCDTNQRASNGTTALQRSVDNEFGDIVSLLIRERFPEAIHQSMDCLRAQAFTHGTDVESLLALLKKVDILPQEETPVAEDDAFYLNPAFLAQLSLSGSGRTRYSLLGGRAVEVFTRLPSLCAVTSRSFYDRDELPLFADNVWPGSLVLADMLQTPLIKDRHVVGKRVVEIGAGAALPSVVASFIGAKFVCSCDYPGEGVIHNISAVLLHNGISADAAVAVGHAWGDDVTPLILLGEHGRYDTALLAELLWKDTVVHHEALCRSVRDLLAPGGVAFVTFAHRSTSTHPETSDLAFFDVARCLGFSVHRLPSVRQYADVDEMEPAEVQVFQMTIC